MDINIIIFKIKFFTIFQSNWTMETISVENFNLFSIFPEKIWCRGPVTEISYRFPMLFTKLCSNEESSIPATWHNWQTRKNGFSFTPTSIELILVKLGEMSCWTRRKNWKWKIVYSFSIFFSTTKWEMVPGDIHVIKFHKMNFDLHKLFSSNCRVPKPQ